jgi:hypothetical protein
MLDSVKRLLCLGLSGLAAVLVLTLSATDAHAQQTGVLAPPQKGGVITINEVTIVGRVQKPVASVDVSKIQPKLTLAELRQPFLDRIEEAARKDPF